VPDARADADVVKVAEEIVREEFPAASSAPAPVATPHRAPTAVEPPPPPVMHAPPPVELDWPSDLVQVESNPERIRAAQKDSPLEDDAPRPRRERPVRPPVVEEPLVQVETGGKSPAEAPPA